MAQTETGSVEPFADHARAHVGIDAGWRAKYREFVCYAEKADIA